VSGRRTVAPPAASVEAPAEDGAFVVTGGDEVEAIPAEVVQDCSADTPK
jgi:hypothetical protein